jgi:tetratricopeptide (TPR) repeat protein
MSAVHWQLLATPALAILMAAQLTSADPRAKAEAKRHIDHAAALHAQGKFAQALDELKTAFSLDPRPELLYAMGQIHVSLGKCPQAIMYYRRYLAMNPDPDTAGAAREAIQACASNPPPAATTSASTADDPAAPVASDRAWYRDYVADTMVAGGIAAGLVGIFEYRSAVQDRDRADTATSYQRYVQLVDQAHNERVVAVVVGVAGAALAAAGGLHYVFTRQHARQTISFNPGQGGGIVSWTGRF